MDIDRNNSIHGRDAERRLRKQEKKDRKRREQEETMRELSKGDKNV
jgi:hypothetical protein